jgi:hypothetical protein
MSVTASDFHALIRPKVPSCPIPVIDTALRSAAAEFCKRTRCWRAVVEIEHEDGWTEFEPTVPTGGVIHELAAAWWDTCSTPLTRKAFDQFTPAELAETGAPEFITQLSPGNFRLVPRDDGDLVLNLIIAPPDLDIGLTVTLPDFMAELHGEAIAAGTLARVLALPGEWRDPGLAGAYAAVFEDRIGRATGSDYRGQQNTRMRVTARFV